MKLIFGIGMTALLLLAACANIEREVAVINTDNCDTVRMQNRVPEQGLIYDCNATMCCSMSRDRGGCYEAKCYNK